MPYTSIDDLPDSVKKLPIDKQKQFLAAFNDCIAEPQNDEEKCFAVAWGAVKEDFVAEAFLSEAKDDAGTTWEVTLIESGMSKNRHYYPAATLAKAVPLFEGVQSFDGHDERPTGAVKELVGFFDGVKAVNEGGHTKLTATFHVLADWLRSLLLAAHRQNKLDVVGFSIYGSGKKTPMKEQTGHPYYHVEEITSVDSVDVVSKPAAGGNLRRLVAALGVEINETKLKDDETQMAEIEEQMKQMSCEVMLVKKLSNANLTQLSKDVISERFEGKVFEEAELDAAIKEHVRITAAFEKKNPAKQTVTIVQEGLDVKKKALDGMFAGKDVDGVPRFNSIKTAYMEITGKRPTSNAMLAEAIMRDTITGFGALNGIYNEDTGAIHKLSQAMLAESLQTSSWGQILGDSVTRRMIAEYSNPKLNVWRQIASEVGVVADFRTNRRTRYGGYGVLPAVGQGGTYQPLTSPTDEEAIYAISKKGGTEDLTLEMIANDDISAIKRIPIKLGRAAAKTLYRDFFDLFRLNATCTYDSVALFDAAHSNTGTVALSADEIEAIQTVFSEVVGYNDDDPLDLEIRYLLVPSELYRLASELAYSPVKVTSGGDSTILNIYEKTFEPIKIPYWTDSNDYVAVADPTECPTVEVGFYESEEPQLFIQDAPNIGSVFSADKTTFKIRYIYGLTPIDHRGFYKNVVA